MEKTAEMRRDVMLGELVIMSNHLHRVLRIIGNRNPEGGRKKTD
jgi:hypothetical protein